MHARSRWVNESERGALPTAGLCDKYERYMMKKVLEDELISPRTASYELDRGVGAQMVARSVYEGAELIDLSYFGPGREWGNYGARIRFITGSVRRLVRALHLFSAPLTVCATSYCVYLQDAGRGVAACTPWPTFNADGRDPTSR